MGSHNWLRLQSPCVALLGLSVPTGAQVRA